MHEARLRNVRRRRTPTIDEGQRKAKLARLHHDTHQGGLRCVKFAYIPHLRLNTANRARLQLVNSIIEEYRRQGYTLTLRQLYYQLVSKDIIANKLSEYSKLSTLPTQGR